MENQIWVNQDRNNLILQTRYGREYGQRLARFYSRASNVFRFLQVFSGSAAFSIVIAKVDSPLIMAAAGIIMAVVSAIDMVWQPQQLANRCTNASKKWGRLSAKASRLDDDALREKVTRYESMSLPAFESLRNPVFNEIMRQIGSDQRTPVTFWQKLMFSVC